MQRFACHCTPHATEVAMATAHQPSAFPCPPPPLAHVHAFHASPLTLRTGLYASCHPAMSSHAPAQGPLVPDPSPCALRLLPSPHFLHTIPQNTTLTLRTGLYASRK